MDSDAPSERKLRTNRASDPVELGRILNYLELGRLSAGLRKPGFTCWWALLFAGTVVFLRASSSC